MSHTPKKNDDGPLIPFLTVLVVGALFTLGWNYGITEFIENFGGGDPNVNVLEGILAWLAFRSLGLRVVEGDAVGR